MRLLKSIRFALPLFALLAALPSAAVADEGLVNLTVFKGG